MSPRARTALRLALVATAANAALLVLQTVVLQLMPWDSSSFGMVSTIFRSAFWLGDLALLASFVVLAFADPALRGFVTVGAALTLVVSLGELAGLGASALGSTATNLRAVSLEMGAAEPYVSLGSSLLMLLALRALAPRRALAPTIVVAVSILMSLAFHAVRQLDPGARSLAAAWISWLGEVSRPAALAALAFFILRPAVSDAKANDTLAGPYRAAGEGAPAQAPPPRAPDPITAERVGAAARGLALYRIGFLVRVGTSVFGTLLLFVSLFSRSSLRSDDALMVTFIPLAGFGTAVLLAVSLGKMLAMPRASKARVPIAAALGLLVVIALVDARVLVGAVDGVSTAYGAARRYGELVMIEWAATALAFAISVLLLASALERAATTIDAAAVVRRARWVQGLVVGSTCMSAGSVLSMVSYQATRYDSYPRSEAGLLVPAFFAVAAFASFVTVPVLHVLLVGGARRALDEYATTATG